MSVVNDFSLTTPLLGNQTYISPVVDFLSFNTLATASFYNTTDATQTTQQIIFQFSAERTDNFNFTEVVVMTLNEGISKSFPIRARFGRYIITNTSSINMTELRLSSTAFEEIQEVGINQVDGLEQILQTEVGNRVSGDLNLQNQIFLKANQVDLNLEAVARATEDIRLDQALSQRATTQSVLDEQGARESGDVLLQLNINAEQTSRQLGDTNLQISIDNEITARALADTNIQTAVDTKATITALAIETSARETADSTIQNELNTKASTADLNTEIADRISADTILLTNLNTEIQDRQIQDNLLQANIDTENNERVSADTQLESNLNFKLDTADSIHRVGRSFYAVDGRDNLTSVFQNISAQGSILSFSSGSFGTLQDTELVINKQNMSMYAPPSTPPLCEFLMPITIPNTADRIRMRFLSFDNVATLNASRSVYNQCSFTENVNIGQGTTGYITFKDCEFVAGKTITVSNTFASVLFFIGCNFGGATLVLNQASNQQVILSNCGGLISFPSNATLAVGNALTNGFVQLNVAKTILATTGTGNVGQVLTSSGSASLPDTWTTITSGGGGESTCLELIHLYPRGQSITTKRGDTLTFQNVSERQLLTQSATDLTGSVISYRPPTGTTKVIYTFYTHLSNRAIVNSNIDANFRCFFGSTQVSIARQYISLAQASAVGYHEFSVVFNIGGTQNIGNAIIGSWNALVQLKWDGARQSQFTDFHIHNLLGFDEQTIFSHPKIKIEAYA